LAAIFSSKFPEIRHDKKDSMLAHLPPAEMTEAPLRDLHPQISDEGAGPGVQLAGRPARERARRSSPARSRGLGCLPDRYDDGGFTGGNMDRPALKRLLKDIDAGKVDCVVVYKVDRLSRSLLDFARIMETSTANVSFVSVTQQFNTATSMGRLTLNILLSFAQFEREIIGERIRDKMAAASAAREVGGRRARARLRRSWIRRFLSKFRKS
jgi:DNA invertase Pin-like site-specific DNA recombinase